MALSILNNEEATHAPAFLETDFAHLDGFGDERIEPGVA
jgi:hypothetical protein